MNIESQQDFVQLLKRKISKRSLGLELSRQNVAGLLARNICGVKMKGSSYF